MTVGLLAVITAPLAGCSSGPHRAAPVQTTLSAFTKAWSAENWAAMGKLVSGPPAGFETINRTAYSDLGVTKAKVTAGPVTTKGKAASATLTERLVLKTVGPLVLDSTVHLVEQLKRWYVKWSPATIAPAFRSGDRFSVSYMWPKRALVLGSGGAVLADEQAAAVIVGVQGSFIKNASSLAKDLMAAGAPAAAVRSAIKAATANPTAFEPVFTISAARYAALKPTLYPIPGTVFKTGPGSTPSDPGLIPVLGTIGPITSAELKQLGPPYAKGDVVGQTGIEAAEQRQLAGKPGAAVAIVGPTGSVVKTIATTKPRRGDNVVTSINPHIQAEAEAALSGETLQSALVAINTSTAQVEAVVNQATGGFDLGLDGEQPPGSTFKVITSTALFKKGLTPSSPASCPTTIDVDGEILHNALGELPVSNILEAFTESCNTAFIGLATANLDAESLHEAALVYHLGDSLHLGLKAFGGSVPLDPAQTAIAESAIGQAQVVVSPLDLAMVAADIDSGRVRLPRLVSGARDDHAPATKLPASLDAYLHEMMLSVAEQGTAANLGLPAGTYAKTGTADHGTTAFCMIVVNAPGDGGPVDAPLVAPFLDAVG